MNDNIIVWEADIECTECNGTGLYQGFAEKRGCAVICTRCEGTGKRHIKLKYNRFVERKISENIKRVFQTSGGYGISADDVTLDNDEIIHFSKAGCTYQEWLNGINPRPIIDLHCPLEHFQQGSKTGEWLKDTVCEKNKLYLGSLISECSRKHRAKCWEWYEENNIEEAR